MAVNQTIPDNFPPLVESESGPQTVYLFRYVIYWLEQLKEAWGYIDGGYPDSSYLDEDGVDGGEPGSF